MERSDIRERPPRISLNSMRATASNLFRPTVHSSQYRKRADFVSMRDLASEHRIFQLEGEFIGRPHAALRGKRAAEHHRARRKLAALVVAGDQVFWSNHRRDRPLLIEHAPAVLDHVR